MTTTIWFTVEKAAEHASVSVATIRREIKKLALPAYRIGSGGRLLRLRAEDVDQWIQKGARS